MAKYKRYTIPLTLRVASAIAMTPGSPLLSLLVGVDPAVEILNDIRAGKKGNDETWFEVQFESGDFEAFNRRIKEDPELAEYINENIRIDYDPIDRIISLRRLSQKKKLFINMIAARIEAHLSQYPYEKSLQPLKRRVREQKTITLDDRSKVVMSPDIAYKEHGHPRTMIVVCGPNTYYQMRRVAENYLSSPDGESRAVISFSIQEDTTKSSEASMTIWEAFGQGETLDVGECDAVFRNTKGELAADLVLGLSVNLFAHYQHGNATMSISAEDIGDDLEKSEHPEKYPELAKYFERKTVEGDSDNEESENPEKYLGLKKYFKGKSSEGESGINKWEHSEKSLELKKYLDLKDVEVEIGINKYEVIPFTAPGSKVKVKCEGCRHLIPSYQEGLVHLSGLPEQQPQTEQAKGGEEATSNRSSKIAAPIIPGSG